MADPVDDNLTPKDLRVWLRDETRWVLKEAELRIRDATDFVTAYSAGELSPEEAMKRRDQYDDRWGETKLVVAMPDEHTPNEEIIRNLDRQNEEWRRSVERPLRGERGRN
jgi:hypothetical protein